AADEVRPRASPSSGARAPVPGCVTRHHPNAPAWSGVRSLTGAHPRLAHQHRVDGDHHIAELGGVSRAEQHADLVRAVWQEDILAIVKIACIHPTTHTHDAWEFSRFTRGLVDDANNRHDVTYDDVRASLRNVEVHPVIDKHALVGLMRLH